MEVVNTISELQKILNPVRISGKSIGLVPTMGALHAGHIALVSRSVDENDFTVVTIFVNPTQFNNPEDLVKYPRTPERDLSLLREASCDLVFVPAEGEMYEEDELKKPFEFDFAGLDKVMEGRFRPGHFNGVVQIVSKLFNITEPTRAYFGEKDFQQLSIIHHMNRQMNFGVQIVDCPIVREPSGLAMSSRNERLNANEREIAAGISKVLFDCRNFVAALSPAKLKTRVEDEINQITGLELEYFEIANIHTLQTARSWDEPTVGCIAVFCGPVRLIDNIRCS